MILAFVKLINTKFCKSIFLAALLLLVLGSCTETQNQSYSLIKVIDGDSLLLRVPESSSHEGSKAGTVEVRLLGIDAPEYKQKPWGPRAQAYLQEQLHDGQGISLEFENKTIDKYGRTLAYVYNDLGELVNQKLLEEGFAVLFITKDTIKHKLEFKEAVSHARAAKINIWHETNGIKMRPYEFRKRHPRK